MIESTTIQKGRPVWNVTLTAE